MKKIEDNYGCYESDWEFSDSESEKIYNSLDDEDVLYDFISELD
jgi:hypothetical protein